MSDKCFKRQSFWLLAGFSAVALAVFACTYPTHFIIADEVAYFEQALEWGSDLPGSFGHHSVEAPNGVRRHSDYPPGTALLVTGFIALFGPKAVFWNGIAAWLLGIWALAFLLRRLGKPVAWALYPALFLPGLVLARTLMSDLPSFALASVFLHLFASQSTSPPVNQSTSPPVHQSTNQPINQSTRFAAGLVAGAGVVFRETNLLWALPFLVGAVLHGRAYWKTLWIGFAIGLIPRLAWGWFAFDDPLFVRDSGITFSLSFLSKNLGFYLLALLVLAPGALYFLVKNQSPYRWEIGAVVLLFLAVYGCYGYDAFAKSGYKALVLQGRFLLPLLPFVALAAAETMPRVGRSIQVGIGATALALFVGVQLLGHSHNTEQQRITDTLLQLPTATHYTFTPDESRKYLNALHGKQTLLVPTQNSKFLPAEALAEVGKTQNCYAHLITRSENADWLKKTGQAEAAFERYFCGRETTLVTDLTIRDGTRLRVWRVQQTN